VRAANEPAEGALVPIVFGKQVQSVEEIVDAFLRHGDLIRCTYRARYTWTPSSTDAHSGTSLERPAPLRDNPAHVVFPWEQLFVAAATCAGSDYPVFAAHLEIPLQRAELIVEGEFDPRPEFDGLHGFTSPTEHAYSALRLRATLESPAPRAALEKLHARVVARNMVLNGLRGIPRTDELIVRSV
jgi:hypothetical protein